MSQFSKTAMTLMFVWISCVVVSRAHAEIVSASASGDATIGATPDSAPLVDFNGFGGNYPASAFVSSVTGLAGATLTFQTDGNYDYAPGSSDRLVLDVTNNTSAALPFIDFTVGNGASIYLFIANSYEVFPGPYSSGTIVTNENIGVGSTSTNFNYTFPTPLAVGASEGFYFPLLVPSIPTTFTITESFTSSVPEPSTMLLAALGGFGLAIRAIGRRARDSAIA